MVRRVLTAVRTAEARLGRPPGVVEVFEAFDEEGLNNWAMPVADPYKVAAIMMSLLREHLLFTDLGMRAFTCE